MKKIAVLSALALAVACQPTTNPSSVATADFQAGPRVTDQAPSGDAALFFVRELDEATGRMVESTRYLTPGEREQLVSAGKLEVVAPDTREGAERGQRYIITFRDAVEGAKLLADIDAFVSVSLPRLGAVAAYVPAAGLARLKHSPFIESIEVDQPRRMLSETTPYGITQSQSDLVAEAAGTGTGKKVCIIDSGYFAGHEDLPSSNVTFGKALRDKGRTPNGGPASEDQCGHGTHVAGTIGAVGGNGLGVVGVNPGGDINLHIVRVFGDDCGWEYSSGLANALSECTDAGSDIVSMSLGGGAPSGAEESAFNNALANDVLSIAAAGNDGNTAYSFPASYDAVMSVAAIDSAKAIADFSQQNDQVEIAAAGVGVLSTVPFININSMSVDGLGALASVGGIEGAATGSASGQLVAAGKCLTALDSSVAGKIVLCERGDIAFADKVNNAQAGGAAGVAIYNNVPGGFAGTMGGVPTNTVAVSLSQEEGQDLVANHLGANASMEYQFQPNASGYEAWNGTSMATPHVAGVAALIWNNNPAATAAQVRAALTSTAEDLGTSGRDDAFGYGLVQAADANAALASAPPPTCVPSEEVCDGVDNDCNDEIDEGGVCDEPPPPPSCDLADVGESCVDDGDCCSNKCKGRSGAKTCK